MHRSCGRASFHEHAARGLCYKLVQVPLVVLRNCGHHLMVRNCSYHMLMMCFVLPWNVQTCVCGFHFATCSCVAFDYNLVFTFLVKVDQPLSLVSSIDSLIASWQTRQESASELFPSRTLPAHRSIQAKMNRWDHGPQFMTFSAETTPSKRKMSHSEKCKL